jgi:hypothetical protein
VGWLLHEGITERDTLAVGLYIRTDDVIGTTLVLGLPLGEADGVLFCRFLTAAVPTHKIARNRYIFTYDC